MYNIWDKIAEFRGVSNLLMDLAMKPEFMHKTAHSPLHTGATRRKDAWGRCSAQIFAAVSPEMHDEFVLKDISTIASNPQNLTRWAETASQVIDEYY